MTPLNFFLPYALALVLTLIIEGSLCLLLLKSKAWLKFTCLVNLFTNPLVNFIYTSIYYALEKQNSLGNHFLIVALLELAVWLSEGWLFFRFSRNQHDDTCKFISSIYKALLFSLILNATSYCTGLLLQL